VTPPAVCASAAPGAAPTYGYEGRLKSLAALNFDDVIVGATNAPRKFGGPRR